MRKETVFDFLIGLSTGLLAISLVVQQTGPACCFAFTTAAFLYVRNWG